MKTQELTKWLRDNSAGYYSPSAEAADMIEGMIKAIENVEDAAYSVQDWSGTHLGESLDDARKAAGLPAV